MHMWSTKLLIMSVTNKWAGLSCSSTSILILDITTNQWASLSGHPVCFTLLIFMMHDASEQESELSLNIQLLYCKVLTRPFPKGTVPFGASNAPFGSATKEAMCPLVPPQNQHIFKQPLELQTRNSTKMLCWQLYHVQQKFGTDNHYIQDDGRGHEIIFVPFAVADLEI